MNILKLETYLQTNLKKPDSVEIVRLRYSKLLNSLDFWTKPEYYGISFRSKNNYKKNGDMLRVFREGDIFIDLKNGQLNVNWSVKLDLLYFLCALIGFVSGFTVSLYLKTPLYQSIMAGFVVFILSVSVGIIAMKNKIDEINNTCLK